MSKQPSLSQFGFNKRMVKKHGKVDLNNIYTAETLKHHVFFLLQNIVKFFFLIAINY